MAERPSPHSVAVCTLIALHSDDEYSESFSPPYDDEGKTGGGGATTTFFDTEEISSLIRDLVLSPVSFSSPPFFVGGAASSYGTSPPPFTSLLSQIRQIDGDDSARAQSLLFAIQSASESIDSLVDHFSYLRSVVSEGKVDGDSVHGVYIRRQCLGFDGLPFEAVGRFWGAVREYVEEGVSGVEMKGGSGGGTDGTAARHGPESDEENWPHRHNTMERWIDRTQRSGSKRGGPEESPTATRQKGNASFWPPSTRQIERPLQLSCQSLPQNLHLSFEQTHVELSTLLADHPEVPALHFLRFLHCLQSSERVGALESLHRYFDYAVIHERRHAYSSSSSAGTSASIQGSAAGSGGGAEARNNNVMQYAAILLALLHDRFGDVELSRKATEEAIRVAQQSGDTRAVAFALGWLHRNTRSIGRGKENGGGGEEELLRRCASRASECGLPTLAAGAWLSLASMRAATPPSSSTPVSQHWRGSTSNEGSAAGGVNASAATVADRAGGDAGGGPADAWESIMSATTAQSMGGGAGGVVGGPGVAGSHHHHHHGRHHHHGATSSANSPSAGGASASDLPTCITHLTDSSEILPILAQQQVVSSGIWESYGNPSMASLASFIAMQCYGEGEGISGSDVTLAVRTIANSALHGDGMRSIPVTFGAGKGTDLCQELRIMDSSQTSNSECSEDDKPIAMGRTVYDAALGKIVALLKRRKTLMSSHHQSQNHDRLVGSDDPIAFQGMALILNEWSIRKTQFHHARSLGYILHSCASPAASHNLGGGAGSSVAVNDTTFQTLTQLAFLLSRQGQWEKAKAITTTLTDLSKRSRHHFMHARHLLRLALLHLESSPRHPVGALPPLLECLSTCEIHSLDSVHASALAVLAAVHLRLDNPGRARALLTGSMPTIFQHAPVWFRGEACLTLAKCYLHEARQQQSVLSVESPPSDGKAATTTGGQNSANRKPLLHKSLTLALAQLDETSIYFRQIHDVLKLREVYYLQSHICHSLPGRTADRNLAAVRYKEMCTHVLKSDGGPPVWYDVLDSIGRLLE